MINGDFFLSAGIAMIGVAFGCRDALLATAGVHAKRHQEGETEGQMPIMAMIGLSMAPFSQFLYALFLFGISSAKVTFAAAWMPIPFGLAVGFALMGCAWGQGTLIAKAIDLLERHQKAKGNAMMVFTLVGTLEGLSLFAVVLGIQALP